MTLTPAPLLARAALVAALAAWPAALAACAAAAASSATPSKSTTDVVGKVVKTDAEWKKALTAEQYRVLRHQGTEIAFTGAYWNEHRAGTYLCVACGLELFRSKEKFDGPMI